MIFIKKSQKFKYMLYYLFFFRKRITRYNDCNQAAHSSKPKLFSYYSILFWNNFRKTIFSLKMHQSFTMLFPFCFLTNNLLIPDMSCITYRLTSVYLKCFYQFLPFISIWSWFLFRVMSYYNCLIIFYFAWLLH